MRGRNNKSRTSTALTLVEMMIAMAIMAIIFAAILPQLRVINNSWDSKVGASETLQNGRILIDHINRNLSKALRITAVSDSSDTNGYIEFLDNDANNVRYDINSTTDYVEFGLIGNPSDLAGPVSKLQFTCYGAVDLSTPITDVNAIRSVKVETTLINSAMLDQDMPFTTQAYIRTNAMPSPFVISKLSDPWLEFDPAEGMEPALCQIDTMHYLCAYAGPLGDGWAVVLTVDNGNWTITRETPFEYDTQRGNTPALCQIDATHYLCTYTGMGVDGWAVVLTVDTGNWTISKETPFEYDTSNGEAPALYKIDNTHYLCAYGGSGSDGWVNILKVDTGNWTITEEYDFEFDPSSGQNPALTQIDQTHYLCAYKGLGEVGWAFVLTIDTGNWTISKETPFEFDTSNGERSALYRIDNTHYLCTYEGLGSDGWANILKVDTSNWTITKEYELEYDENEGLAPSLAQIDQNNYLCAYGGVGGQAVAVVLNVDTVNWSISADASFVILDDVEGKMPALCLIDDSHYLCTYGGLGDDGYAGVLKLSEQILP